MTISVLILLNIVVRVSPLQLMDRGVQYGGLICDPRIGEGNGSSGHGDEDAAIAEGVLRHEVRILRENATEGGVIRYISSNSNSLLSSKSPL